MSAPILDVNLQGALFALLGADSPPACGAPVYDKVPVDVAFPYVVIGKDHIIGDDDEEEDRSRVVARIAAWSQYDGMKEVETLCGTIRKLIRQAANAGAITLVGFTVDNVNFEQTVYTDDPDGISRQGVVEVEFLITHL